MLSGVSVTWYTWLEQGRDITVSRKVIESIARVLRITGSELAHLYTLAGMRQPSESDQHVSVDSALVELVRVLNPNPAAVINMWWDLLLCNEAYSSLYGGLEHLAPSERNVIRLALTHVAEHDLMDDPEAAAERLLAQLRVHLARYSTDPRGPELVAELSESVPLFDRLWKKHSVDNYRVSSAIFHHPRLGRLELDTIKLATADNENQQLVVFLPANDATAELLDKLRE